ncbi:MAG: hypothetical protein FJ144_22940 [Deltaproteobacteria bacterium]|nr:hypothetical protein [Deltaproteobacteria bacterium]
MRLIQSATHAHPPPQRRANERRFSVAALAPALIAALLTIEEAAAQGRSLSEIRVEELEALGYLEKAEPSSRESGVKVHDTARVQPGMNVYCSSWSGEVRLFTNEGEIRKNVRLEHDGVGGGCHVEPFGPDALIAVSRPDVSVFDLRGKVRWASDADHHHDVAQGPDEELYTLTARAGSLRRGPDLWPILDHAITALDEVGRPRDRLVFSEVFADRVDGRRLSRMLRAKKQTGSFESRGYVRASDVFHPNSIQVLKQPLSGGKAGDVLLCIRELDLVAIVDLEEKRVVWEWGPGELDAPHHATILENGHILVFDNGRRRRWSRVVEIDPASKRIVWQYRADGFFSKLRGAAQRLPNGNTLITESTKGRAFEVTPAGDVVWEFFTPDVTDEGERRQMYRLLRLLPGAETARFLDALSPDVDIGGYRGPAHFASNGPLPICSRIGTTVGFVIERRCQFAPSTTSVWPEMKRP